MPTNAAAPARRARTAAGAVPPQIARDVTRIVACANQAVAELVCCAAPSVGPAIEHMLPGLTTHMSRDLRYVVVRSAMSFVQQHLASHVDTAVDFVAIRSRVEGAFDAAVAPGSLTETISSLVAQGIDAERITWDVISRESVNHAGLIHKECNRLVRTLPDRSPDELKGYGWAGLRTALRNYDPSLGFAFSTFACPKINGAIRDGVRAESPIPKRLTTFVRKVSSAEEQLTHALSRPPSYAEIAAYVDSTSESLHLLPRLVPSASLEELAYGLSGEQSREPSCLVDSADPEDAAVTALRDAALHRAVAELPELEGQAVRLLLLEEMPVGEAAALVGVEPRQLRLRKARGLRALEPVMRAWMDENVLATA